MARKLVFINHRTQVEALRECFDLLQNGYLKIVEWYGDVSWYIKLKHSKNGNVCEVKWKPNHYTISINGKVVKDSGLSSSTAAV